LEKRHLTRTMVVVASVALPKKQKNQPGGSMVQKMRTVNPATVVVAFLPDATTFRTLTATRNQLPPLPDNMVNTCLIVF